MLRALTLALALTALPLTAPAADVTVFAAASLKTALDRVAADWQAASGHSVVISYGGTPQLAKQIIAGAPADLFVSAAVNWMDGVEKAGLILPGSRADLAGNRLVLVAHDPAAAPVTLAPGLDLAGLLAGGKLAMALVDSVPAGVYGKAALTHFGLWDDVATDVAQSDNVRAALALVATGEAPYGIVYGSDAVAEEGVTVVATFPADSHAAIIYPAALIAGGVPEAAGLLEYLASDAAMAIFVAAGFTALR